MKIIKIFLIIIAFIIVSIFIIFLYWNRNQTINFANTLPNSFEHCNRTIFKNDIEYIELKNWFEHNQKNWKNTPASYAPNNYYYSSNPYMSINIGKKYVVINYEDSNKNPHQVIKEKKIGELIHDCK